ncbi:Putative nuclease [Frankliniella fusca]|uniref:Nuclease n=1 Tax=Frankliniella fusca TaxID=407009 RepID=A0AAE1LF01_9NEOP|nr:Putative nuclease [Frankliniella fusca]
MAGLLLLWDEVIENEPVRRRAPEGNEMRVARRRLRDHQDPFDAPDEYFRNIFRVNKELARDLIAAVRPHLRQRTRAQGLSAECQVLCAVRFYAVGSYQRSVGQDFLVALSQTAVSRCVRQVSTIINHHLPRRWVKFPATPHDCQAAVHLFQQGPRPFPGALGAIDCTHVYILKPREHEEAYVSGRIGKHTLNVQLICDPTMKILDVDPRHPGTRHDSAIWMQSSARRMMELCYREGERKVWLIGYSGYLTEPWLMIPINGADPNTPEGRYTTALCRTRAIVEQCIGLLKMVWRCLCQQRVLMYEPAVVGEMVNACVVLHNMRLYYRVPQDDIPPPEVAEPPPQHPPPPDAGGRPAEGRRVRDQLIRDHFR